MAYPNYKPQYLFDPNQIFYMNKKGKLVSGVLTRQAQFTQEGIVQVDKLGSKGCRGHWA